MSRNLKKTLPFKAKLFLEHPEIQNKPRLLSSCKIQGFLDFKEISGKMLDSFDAIR